MEEEARNRESRHAWLKLDISIPYHKHLGQLSNEELADLLIDEVWSDFPLFSKKSALLEETIGRLRNK